jgi:MFS transporter, DHA1 family, multidrug resistance protein
VNNRVRAWLSAWGRLLPLLVAEAVIWLGFGALLPILPLYITEHGVDLPTLGIIVAAWPAARLLGEPLFGWVADRVSRKAMMVVGLLLAAVFAVLPLFAVVPLAFIALRGLAGLAAAIYDPAARGYIVDANAPEKRGEAFGLYGAAQMGGLMLGPVVGGLAAAIAGQPTVVFWVAGLALVVSAVLVGAFVPELHVRVHETPAEEVPGAADLVPGAADLAERPTRLLNRLLIAGVALNVSAYFASGSYEVAWSLYLTSLGAGPEAIGLTFFSFALPVLLVSGWFGKFADREGGFWQIVVGLGVAAVCGTLYVIVPQVWWIVVIGLIEGAAFAAASPALYLLIARAAPAGKASTAQGIFGAAGTFGTIVASVFSGYVAAVDLRIPFVATTVAMLGALLIGLALGGRRLYDALQPHAEASGVPAPVEAAP